MAEMRLLETLWFSFLVALLTEVQQAQGQCNFTSITSPSASNLNISWPSFPGATTYSVELRVVNSTTVAPVVLQLSTATTEKLVQGLHPGSLYQVTLKVYQFSYLMCISSSLAYTVPAASQITFAKAISSTAIRFQWSSAQGALSYVLMVDGVQHSERRSLTSTTLSGDMTGLQPNKPYNCYVFSSNEAGRGAKSSVKTVNTLVQPPSVVTVTTVNYNTAHVTWSTVSGVLLYQVSLMETNQSGVAPLIRNISGLSLNLSNLKPCLSYTIGVSSISMFLQPGEPTTVLYTTNPVPPVSSISVDYSCSNSIASISWEAVFGATSYRAVATSSNGTSLSCTSSGTSCQISALECGERYTVLITSIAACESTSNSSYTFETAPCPPKNPEYFVECYSNVIIFYWEATNNTAYYIAESVDSDGVVNNCVTTNTSCFFPQIECGRNYSFTVSSVYSGAEGCNTRFTLPVTVSAAPCLPQNVRTSALDCLSDTLVAKWDPAPGALSYTVRARGNRDDFYNCTSSGTTCNMTDVKCGQSLSVWISASNNHCITDDTLVDVAETVPCTPQDISLVETCDSFSITLSWLNSNNAVFYTAKAILPNSTIRTCNTMYTQCEITGLECGQTYEAFVMATNFICNSTESQHIIVKSAPCAPVNVHAAMDCQSNTALVQWQGQQASSSYTAVLADNKGGMVNCSTSSNTCSVPNLLCGHTYNITVMQNDTRCLSLPSTSVQIESVPCVPQQVVGVVNCSSGAMTVGWNSSVVGVNYTTAVWSGTGDPVYCNSSEPHCSVGQLDCGKAYQVTVLAARGTCQSAPSQQITVEQVPCIPTNVAVSRECGAASVGITWAPSPGAHTYIAIATDTHGQRSECTSNGTSCSITHLACGQVYSVGVMAANDNCSSQLSQTVAVHTDPCAPTNISGLVNCSTSTASLLWSPSPNALHYIGKLESHGDVRTCNVSTTGCQISGLLCGQRYNFSVSASDGSCPSAQTAPIQLDTAPCAPQNVSTTVACNTSSVTVSWSPAAVSQNYVAIAVWNGGSALSCSSQSTSCTMQGLQCGQQYNITVSASNGNCSGPASPVQTIQTAPCIPQNVNGHVTCGSGSLVASWDAAPGASSYIAMISALGGPQVCVTANLSCVFTGLQCARQYNLSVASQNGICNSTNSPVTTLSTGPCDPQNVTAVLQCSTSAATVTWSASTGASRYTVLAQTDGDQTLAASCSTSSTSCQLTSLTCGKTFNITVLAGDATCNSTSQHSGTVATAPCLPTILNTSLDCATNAALLSWTPVSNAVRYIVNATSSNGHKSSCISSNFNCSLTGLACGQTYSVYATAQGQQCDSSPSTSVNVITAPCPPSMVNTYYDCRNNTALIGWSGSDGSITFVALLQGDGYSDSCSTTGTNCSLTSLRCGRAYSVTVKAVSSHCNSSYSQAPGIQTVPCATQNVSASWQCANHSAVVAWSPVAGVSLYGVTALGVDGDVKQCNSTTSTCQLSQMHCGQAYDITVTPYINNCTGVRSAAFSFNTGPCAPTNLSVDLQCQGNVAAASWLPAAGADSYVATATASDGHTHNCTSASTSCSFTDLHCGESYSISVVTLKNGCPSDSSGAVSVRTAPCLPTILNTSLDCATNAALLSWTPVSYAVRYVVNATSSNGHKSSCISSNFNCSLTGLTCGQTYSVYATAQGQQCDSSPSTSVNVITAPCPPSMVNTYYDCRNNTALIGWSGSDGSITFVALLQGDGYSDSCSTTGTNCSITSLRCGRAYNVTVKAVSSHCNSSYSQAPGIQTVPCATQNVSASWQCANHSAVVAWSSVAGVSLYGVTALGVDGDVKQCNSTTSTCQLSQMHCGQAYDITVTPYINNCTGVRSAAFSFNTGPCAPTNLSVDLQCQGNVAAASWLPAAGADSYVATATASDGHTHNCTSTSTSCSFTDLHCGESYSISVVTLKNGCPSDSSGAVSVRTVPCVPPNVSATVDCRTNAGNISWGSVAGAVAYNAKLVAGNGLATYCSTGGTSCVVTLECGQNYSAVVVASTDVCNSSQSTSLQFRSAPCPPTHVLASLNCSSNSAFVSWDSTPGATLYLVRAVGSAGYNTSCNNTSPQCSITNLQCGQDYSIRVTAQHNDCFSPASQDTILSAAPCAPTGLNVTWTCNSNTTSVTWTPSSSVVAYYIASAEPSSGLTLTCNSSSTSCDISSLTCGETYNVSVTAYGRDCVGGRSLTYTLKTAPCAPQTVQFELLTCQSGNLSVVWQPTSSVQMFRAEAVTFPGHLLSCYSASASCVIPNLGCGQTYDVSVVAVGDSCNSSRSIIRQASTAPCPPSSVAAVVNCSTNTATVSWNPPNILDVVYIARAVNNMASPPGVECNSTNSSCTLTGLQCSTQYNVTVTATKNNCTSAPSAVYSFFTAPCVPTLSDVVLNCDSGSALALWSGVVLGSAELYTVTAVDGQGEQLGCNNTQTQSCTVQGLQCGRTYTFSLAAAHGQCNSMASNTLQTHSAACPAQAIRTTIGCRNNTASVSWSPGEGAVSYSATLQSLDGHTYTCNSTTTSCDVTNLPCGQTYSVTVAAKGLNCSSTNSTGSPVTTAPCVPQNVSASVNCSSNIGTVSWQSSQGATLYFVIANSSNGQSTNCSSATTSCDLSSLVCGLTYTVTVMAKDSNCTSACSAPVQLQTAPCVPTLSDVVLNCSSGSALAVWSGAGSGSGGADLYSATAVDGLGGELRCNNTQTASCIVFGLQCGRTYTFSVTAARGQCTSMASNILQTHTAACPARAIQTTISCRNNTASVSWSPGAGAVSYSATLQSSDGHTYPCNSTTTSCDITNLPCGQTYSVTVAARGLNCSSTNSVGSPVTTAPCVPQNVSSSVNCSSNIAVVSWQHSQGAALYFAVANSSNGQSVNCTSASTSCNLAPLACGLTYTVTVMAKDSNCTSACSAPVQLQTVPCVPQNVVAGVDCETNNVTVSWSPSMGAHLYTATLRDGDGLSGTCQSNEVQCNATGLRCGQMYHVSVTASNDQCTSTPSTSTDVHSVPCAPSSISAVLNCTTDVAEVMWWPSAGSQGYRVSATASLGQIASCSSNNSSTSCSLGSLTCGAEYTVSVQALGAMCNSSADMNGHLVTEPCVPHLLPVQYQNSIAQFSWDFTQGADSFVALAVTQQNLNITCPETTDTNCALSGMQCGQIYNVSVSAHNSACNGTGTATSSSHQLMTEPCPPQNVQARMNCSSLIAYISWDASLVAVGYVVFLNGWNGDSWISATSQTSHSYPGLSCGTHYTTYVKALGQVYNSSESDSVNLLTAPCVPDSTSVSVQVDCATDTALLSWAFGSAGVDNYTAVVLGSGGHISSCSTEQNQCNVSLLCGQSYNLTLISVNQQCQIPTVMNTTFHSRPCEPVGVAVNVLCNTSSAEMSWQRAQGVDYYIGRAVRAGDGHESVCNSTSSSCMFSTLACGQNYTFTVTAYTGHCSSNTSQPVYISAGPCRPDNLTAQVFCANQTVALDWSDAPGAWQYVVTVSGDLGLLLNFSSASSALSISLACGQSYSVIVLGQDQHCISQRSAPVFFRSAPCAPSGLIAARYGQASGCGSAGAVLSWNASAGADMYVVKGWSLDGHTFSLSTSLSTISLSDLVCSQTYNLTVTASNQQCNSTPSLAASLQTGPCSAAEVSAVLDCVSSVAVVSWHPNNGTAIYTVTLLDSTEPPRSCVGVGSQCNISGLACGKNYSVSVTVSNDQCNSTTTLPTSLQTAPCPPVNIFLTPGCANNSAVVVWDHSQGAISYNAYAVSSNGNISCQSTLPTCILTNLTCGSNYSVHVVAVGNNCSSAPSQPVVHSSVPCQPTNVSVAVQCANGTAVLSWAAQTGAVQYFATAQSDNGTSLYCQTTRTFCTLQGLQCGAVYNFTVLASNGACNSSYSQTLTGGGVPCPPGSFRVVPSVLLGQGQLLRAYWSIVNCPNSRYLLEVSGSIQGDSQSLFQISSYWTSRTYFETPVPCSSTYSATVRAQNSGGTSAPTAVLTGTSVPCPPLAVTFTGSNSSAVVAWNASLYATVYHVYQVTSNGRIALCNTSQLSCPVTNVSSNLIMVTAGNAAGESAGTSTVTVRATRRRRDLRQTETGELASPKAHFTMVTSDSLWLEWTHVKDAKSYSLLIREQSSSSKPIITTVYGEASIISELKPATTYCVSLSARNSYSSGAYSEPVCVQTAALS